MIDKQQKGARRDDIAAGLHYVLARYLIGTLGGGKSLIPFFSFQGGVALNHAVAAALQYFTRARIIVPEHTEVMGAIGAAVCTRKKCSVHSPFIGLEKAGKRCYSVTSFQCEGCANFCNVSKVTTSDGVTLYGGDICERYSLSPGQKEKPSSRVPDLFKERERLLQQDFPNTTQKSLPRVGIPRVFSQYYEYFPLWNRFFPWLLRFSTLPWSMFLIKTGP